MEGEKVIVILCEKCKNQISPEKEKYVRLSTIDNISKIDSHTYFHLDCWSKYVGEAVTKKANNLIQNSYQKMVSIFKTPAMKETMERLENLEKNVQLSFLPPPNPKKVIEVKGKIDKIEEKKIHGKGKKRARKIEVQ